MTSPVDPQTEQRWISSALRGDIDAFNLLVEQYERLVFAVAYRMLRDRQAAEDVTQDTFIRAYSSLGQFNGASFRAWLTRIATNRCYDQLRGRQRKPAESLDAQLVEQAPTWSVEPLPADPERLATRAELGRRLEHALDLLPEDQRLVVVLYDVHGYAYEEIAQITAVSLGTVKSRLSRARSRLRDILKADKESRELFETVGRHLNDDDAAGAEDLRRHGKAERTE